MKYSRILTLGFALAIAGAAQAKGPKPLLLTEYGVAASVGGGVFNYTGSDMRGVTDPGGAWGARVVVGTRMPLAVEVAYLGTAQNMQSLAGGSALVANGVESALRLNFLAGEYQPYIFAGIGWKHYGVTDYSASNEMNAKESDDVGEVPLGVGFAFHYEGFVADARFDFRPSFDNELVPGFDDNSLTSWGVNAQVGWEF